MKTLTVDLGSRSYPIHIGQQLLDNGELLTRHIRSRQVMVVSNDTVAPLYLESVKQQLTGFETASVILPDGEQYKNLEILNTIFTALLEQRFNRDCTLIALGGGVVGDITGFAAASYQRGVAFLQIPTTLLAQVDSSVGGKTGVNHPLGKNMIGAFHQPGCVVIDTETLDTLDDRQLSAGLAEVIKYGLIRDADFFDWLETNMATLKARDKQALAYAIDRQKILNEKLLHENNLLNGRLVTAPYYTGLQVYNQQVPQREYNFPLAVALAVASQKKLGGQFPRLHMLCDPNPEAQDAAQELIRAWQRIGVNVTLIPNTPEEAKKEKLEWDIVYRTTAMTEPIMELWPFLTVGRGAEIKSLEIFPDWMRQKLIELDEATDWETATALLKKLQQQLYSMAHIVPLWEIDQFHVFRTNIKGYADRPLNFYDNVEQWVTTPVYPRVETLTSTQTTSP